MRVFSLFYSLIFCCDVRSFNPLMYIDRRLTVEGYSLGFLLSLLTYFNDFLLVMCGFVHAMVEFRVSLFFLRRAVFVVIVVVVVVMFL